VALKGTLGRQNEDGQVMEIVSLENAEHYTWGDVCDGWHLLKTNALSVIQERVPPGAFEVKHYHEKAHQFFFVLSGEATLEFKDKKLVFGPQQGVSVPPNVPHRLLNKAKVDLSFIVVSSPKSHGDRVLVG
jgi:mannose-6-phosphate isomerase-like protein (cupin superfamily)